MRCLIWSSASSVSVNKRALSSVLPNSRLVKRVRSATGMSFSRCKSCRQLIFDVSINMRRQDRAAGIGRHCPAVTMSAEMKIPHAASAGGGGHCPGGQEGKGGRLSACEAVGEELVDGGNAVIAEVTCAGTDKGVVGDARAVLFPGPILPGEPLTTGLIVDV